MPESDRTEMAAIIEYMDKLLKTCAEPVPRSVRLVCAGGFGMLLDILERNKPEPEVVGHCDGDACDI